jgi:broad specificity polyphosphatase/5'/3'-nucleotidase SurE
MGQRRLEEGEVEGDKHSDNKKKKLCWEMDRGRERLEEKGRDMNSLSEGVESISQVDEIANNIKDDKKCE